MKPKQALDNEDVESEDEDIFGPEHKTVRPVHKHSVQYKQPSVFVTLCCNLMYTEVVLGRSSNSFVG